MKITPNDLRRLINEELASYRTASRRVGVDRLRQIIREEMEAAVGEADDKTSEPQAAKDMKGKKTDVKGTVNASQLASTLNMKEQDLKDAISAVKKGDASKGAALLAALKGLLFNAGKASEILPHLKKMQAEPDEKK